MSVSLERNDKLQTVGIQAPAGVDAQGKPTYATSVDVQARVVRRDEIVRLPGGEEVRSMAIIWVPASQSTQPAMDARLTLVDGFVGIVVDRSEVSNLQGVLDHVRVKIREE